MLASLYSFISPQNQNITGMDTWSNAHCPQVVSSNYPGTRRQVLLEHPVPTWALVMEVDANVCRTRRMAEKAQRNLRSHKVDFTDLRRSVQALRCGLHPIVDGKL